MLHFFCINLAINYTFWKYGGVIEEIFNEFVVFFDRLNRKFQIHFWFVLNSFLMG